MSSNSPFIICRYCGEQNFCEDRRCWICESPLYDNLSLQTPKSFRRRSQVHRPKSTFGAIEMLISGSVILLTIGLASSRLWGLAILMWMVLLPAGLAIRVRTRKVGMPEKPETTWGFLLHFMSSIIIAIICLVVGGCVIVIALFVICIALISSSN